MRETEVICKNIEEENDSKKKSLFLFVKIYFK